MRVYTYRYTVTTRMTCIKMGSDERHFNVSLIVRDKVTRPCPQTTTFEPRSFRLPAYRLTARPNRLSRRLYIVPLNSLADVIATRAGLSVGANFYHAQLLIKSEKASVLSS